MAGRRSKGRNRQFKGSKDKDIVLLAAVLTVCVSRNTVNALEAEIAADGEDVKLLGSLG